MKFIPDSLGMQIATKSLALQKNSPGILFGLGVAGMATSTVLACRATLKIDDVLEESKKKQDEIKHYQSTKYNDQDRESDTHVVRFRTGVEIIKLYIPAVVVGGLSVAALVGSNRMLTKRNAALSAAYMALEKGFVQYRERVVDKYGEDQDREFRYGSEQVQITDSKTGKKKTVTRVGPHGASVYAVFYDPTCPSWSPDPEINLIFLKCQQNNANDLLRARGHIFLNEVYDMLGVPRSKAGSVVGWALSGKGEGDNYVDFGIFNGESQVARDFVNGREGAILLDFNVDGLIWDKIEEIGDEL
jgi:Family of unknown function (DUF6353)